MKIMKTKIRTLIALIALGIIGFTNINAIADNKRAINTETTNEATELLISENLLANQDFLNLAEALTASEADELIAKYASKQIKLKESADYKSEILSTTDANTALDADFEVERYANKLLSLEKSKIRK
jgi:hypothetical protein